QVRVARERRVERVGEAGVGTHRLHADTDDRPFLGEPAGAVDRDAGRVAGVGELVGVVAAAVPAGAVQQPAALGQRTVLGLPGGDVVDGQQEVWVVGGPVGEVQHHRRRDQPGRRYLGHVLAVLAG